MFFNLIEGIYKLEKDLKLRRIRLNLNLNTKNFRKN